MHLKPISRKLRHELYGRSMKGGGAERTRGDLVDLKVYILGPKIMRRLEFFFMNFPPDAAGRGNVFFEDLGGK